MVEADITELSAHKVATGREILSGREDLLYVLPAGLDCRRKANLGAGRD